MASRGYFQNALPKIIAVVVLAICAIGFGIVWLYYGDVGWPSFRTLINVALMMSLPVLLLGGHYHQTLTKRWRVALAAVMLVIVAGLGLRAAWTMYQNIIDLREWDFLVFWLNGHVAKQGLNFYEPESYKMILLPITASDTFTSEVIEVGFVYPPPTMFLFLPLGFFGMQSALTLWYVGHSIILALVILLLWKTFLEQTGLIGLALVAALVLLLSGTQSTFYFAQTNFLALLIVILFWRDRDRKRGAIWLACGVFVKPFLAFLFLYPVLRRKWQMIISAFVALVVISLLTIGAFGLENFLDYFEENTASRMPDFAYTEMTNQSLLAATLRFTDYDLNNKSALTQPVFVVLACVLTGVTVWLVYRLDDAFNEWALALTLLLALLLYPSSQTFYSVLLITPILLLWVFRQVLPIGVWGVLTFIVLGYVFISGWHGNNIFLANILFWLILAGISTWTILRQKSQSDESQVYAS